MEIDYFDVGILGTSLISPHEWDESTKTIFIEPKNNYGTTYNSIDKLVGSGYLKKVVVNKKKDKSNCKIESMPFFLKEDNPLVKKYAKKPFDSFLKYVEVRNIYFIESGGDIVKLFNTKNDIVLSDILNNKERYYLYDGIKQKDLSFFREYVKTHGNELLYKIFVKYCVFDDHIMRCFNKTVYIYPEDGISSLCENISLTNARKGAVYLLSDNITISEDVEMSEFKHKVTCEYGIIYLKSLRNPEIIEKEWFVKVLLLKNCKFKNEFLLYVEGNNEIIKVYGMGPNTGVCEKDMQLVYIVKEYKEITREELKLIGIDDGDAILDIDYITKYDINQYIY